MKDEKFVKKSICLATINKALNTIVSTLGHEYLDDDEA